MTETPEPGAMVWHRHRQQAAQFVAVHDLDSDTGVVDFGQDGDARVSLAQLEQIMNPFEARSWSDTFRALRAAGSPNPIPWNQPQRPSERYRAAVAQIARDHGYTAEWISPAGTLDWELQLTDTPAARRRI